MTCVSVGTLHFTAVNTVIHITYLNSESPVDKLVAKRSY